MADARTVLPHLWRFLVYQPFVASVGVAAAAAHAYLERVIFGVGPKPRTELTPADVRVYTDVPRSRRRADRPRHLPHLPAAGIASGRGIPRCDASTVPIRALFGMADIAVHQSLAAPETANADDYTFEPADAGHFVIDERPDLVRPADLVGRGCLREG